MVLRSVSRHRRSWEPLVDRQNGRNAIDHIIVLVNCFPWVCLNLRLLKEKSTNDPQRQTHRFLCGMVRWCYMNTCNSMATARSSLGFQPAPSGEGCLSADWQLLWSVQEVSEVTDRYNPNQKAQGCGRTFRCLDENVGQGRFRWLGVYDWEWTWSRRKDQPWKMKHFCWWSSNLIDATFKFIPVGWCQMWVMGQKTCWSRNGSSSR